MVPINDLDLDNLQFLPPFDTIDWKTAIRGRLRWLKDRSKTHDDGAIRGFNLNPAQPWGAYYVITERHWTRPPSSSQTFVPIEEILQLTPPASTAHSNWSNS